MLRKLRRTREARKSFSAQKRLRVKTNKPHFLVPASLAGLFARAVDILGGRKSDVRIKAAGRLLGRDDDFLSWPSVIRSCPAQTLQVPTLGGIRANHNDQGLSKSLGEI